MSCHRLILPLRVLQRVHRCSLRDIKLPIKTFTTASSCPYETTASTGILKLLDISTFQVRTYAKSRDKPKGGGGKKVEIRDDIMAEGINVDKFRNELQQTLDDLKNLFIKQLSIRSAAGVIETLLVEFEGEEYTIQDLAQINRKNPKVLVLNLASFPQTIPTVIETISKSGMNLNPQQEGTSVFVPIPKVTREHRENLVKGAKTLLNKCKDNIRQVQNKYIKKLDQKQLEGLSQDKAFLIKEQIMVLANQYMSLAEKMKDDKQKELMKEE
ncbi:ribosome-recycling factor, mitochondrial [Planococcus citri]|uniref:ribosome-recycling factor, mitochondrial n=1 Tax=Planococcus citri TaxID=170843 RepID=UPI0031FA2897